MPAPLKDPNTRRRRNKITTAAKLKVDFEGPVPQFPWELWGRNYKATLETKREWKRMWQSPMAEQWQQHDLGTLHTYIQLYEEFQLRRTSSTASELRQQAARFGWDVVSRRRLGWTFEKPKQPEPEPEQREDDDDDFDPRSILRAVQ